MRVIKARTAVRMRRLALVVGAAGLMSFAAYAHAAYRDGELTELNMSDGYVTLSGDAQYQLSMNTLAKLWHERNLGQLKIRPGMRVRIDLAPQPGDSGQGDVVVGIVPLSGAAQ